MENFLKIFRDVMDIAVVAYIIYRIMHVLKGTRALQMLIGLIIIFGAYLISDIIGLKTINWLLSSFLTSIVLIVIILFQDDIRRALVQMGRRYIFFTGTQSGFSIIEEVVKASAVMSTRKIGALIVFQRTQKLKDHVEIGTIIDAEVNSELLQSIFLPHSPLHDGAVIINEGRIYAAGCILPLSTSSKIPRQLGTRHRAAFGITEITDAIVVVVSEETGAISLVVGENIYYNLETGELRKKLNEIFGKESTDAV